MGKNFNSRLYGTENILLGVSLNLKNKRKNDKHYFEYTFRVDKKSILFGLPRNPSKYIQT